MNSKDYDTVRNDPKGCAIAILKNEILEVSGNDAAKFLNGQVTTDTINQLTGASVKSCLLNNTGHMIAPFVIHRLTDSFWIETPYNLAEVVKNTLSRFIVRERVEISNLSLTHKVLTFQGAGINFQKETKHRDGYWMILSNLNQDSSEKMSAYPERVETLNSRFPPTNGFDLISSNEIANSIYEAVLANGVIPLTESTAHILRVESAVPAWGAELTDKTIPLEAGLDNHISFTKGCYMGQEIIARIKSRGHTNWQLKKFSISPELTPGTELWKESEHQSGPAHCRLTSVAQSPTEGWIALGYARAEFVESGTRFVSSDSDAFSEII